MMEDFSYAFELLETHGCFWLRGRYCCFVGILAFVKPIITARIAVIILIVVYWH